MVAKRFIKVGGLGPFLSKTRIEILHKLLETEKAFKEKGGNDLTK